MSRILLVDDDASLLKLMSMRLRSQGYEVDTADSAEGALDRLRQQRADLVLSDLRMGGMDGLALFERIQSQWLGMPVIIMTAHGTIPDAIQATRSGVFSFLTKPIDKDELLVTIEHALSLTRPKQQQEWQSLIQTRNPQMEQLLIQASSIATMDVPVLILGPSGAGKGVMTQALHQASHRRDKPLHTINCAALPWPALDLQLFGEDGQSGLFAEAKGGTLFLDEIGDLSESLQAKLLQVLAEYGQGTPEVRVISSSHQDLVTAMEEGRFREDLFYRLNVVALQVAPLRERVDDIPALVHHFTRQLTAEMGMGSLSWTHEDVVAMQAYPWPGNVRELRNLIERCLLLGKPPAEYWHSSQPDSDVSKGEEGYPLEWPLADVEKAHILQVVASFDGNKSAASRVLGVARKTLERKFKEWAIE